MLAMSCDSILLKKRGCTIWKMTWQALSLSPYVLAKHASFILGGIEENLAWGRELAHDQR